jgi:hypothetical protein
LKALVYAWVWVWEVVIKAGNYTFIYTAFGQLSSGIKAI